MAVFEADFETTTGKFSLETTQVWCSYIENIDDEFDNHLGVRMKDFFDWLNERIDETSIVYFHNLNFDGEFLLNYLSDNARYIRNTAKNGRVFLENDTFTNMSDGVSNHYQITYKTKKGHLVYFKDSYRLLLSSVSRLQGVDEKEKIDYDITVLPESVDDLTKEQIDYIKKDVKTVIPHIKNIQNSFSKVNLTIASTSINDLREKMNGDWDTLFVNKIKAGKIDKNGNYQEGEWDYFKKFYMGGFCYNNIPSVKTILKHIKVLDVNSLYPYIMMMKSMPYGKPMRYCDKNKKCDHIEFLEMVITGKPKEGVKIVPFVPSTTGYSERMEYLSEFTNHLVYFTREMWDLVNKWYEITDYTVIQKTCFSHQEHMFDPFFEHWQEVKQTSKKGSPEYLNSKVVQNSPYGKTGMSPLRKKVFLTEYDPKVHTRKDTVIYGDKHKMVMDYEWTVASGGYIPLAICITSFAKIETIDMANTVNNYCNHIENAGYHYGDTDSVHFTMCTACWNKFIKEVRIDPKKLGWWDLEGSYLYGYYFRRKAYLEFNNMNDNKRNIGWAGVNKSKLDVYTNGDIISGRYQLSKLMKKKVRGGVILIDKEIQSDSD